MNQITAVINQKGGVGKTTTAINLSSGLALQGNRVLLIDLDPQAHSTIGLGFLPGEYTVAVHDVLLKRKGINEVILKTKTNNLWLAPSHIKLEKTEQQITPEMFKETFLSRQIENLDYDFIFIDCRPSLGTLTVNALYACSFIIIPCESARYSLEGFSDLMETIEDVKKYNRKEKQIKILLTKFDSRVKITNEWVFQQLQPYKNLIFETIIRRNEALNQAHIAQEPIFSYKPGSTGAQDYQQLTNEFLKICQT